MKKQMKLLISCLLFAFVLALLPSTNTHAATTSTTLARDNKWVKTDKYYVKLTDTEMLYYKVGSSGTQHRIATKVKCAAVRGTTLVFTQEVKVATDFEDYYEYQYKVKKYSLTAKAVTTLHTEQDYCLRPSSIALYDGYCYVSFFCGDCGGYHCSRYNTSTKKCSYVSALQEYTIYQNGTNLICMSSALNNENEVGKLRIYSLTQKKYIKTISSYATSAAVIGSKLYYIKKNNVGSSNPTYELKVCSLSGTVSESYPIKSYGGETYTNAAFGNGFIVFYHVSMDEDGYLKYNYKTKALGKTSETTYNILRKRYFSFGY